MRDSLKQAFKDKDYRHGYVDEFLNASIATQIKVLREQRGWTQKELADYAKMKQPRISVMENVNYSSWSIKILRELAEAFDLTLRVSFESFGTRINDIERFGRKALERLSFKDDPVFAERKEEETGLPNNAYNETLRYIEHANVFDMAAARIARGKIRPQTEEIGPRGPIRAGEQL